MEQKTYKWNIHGMHCNACVLLTESELKNHEQVEHVMADLKTSSVEVRGDFSGKTEEEVRSELSALMEPHGYALSQEKEFKKANFEDFKIAMLVAVGFALLFFILQKLGIVNLVK